MSSKAFSPEHFNEGFHSDAVYMLPDGRRICAKWNRGCCQETDDHSYLTKNQATVQNLHICCYLLSNGKFCGSKRQFRASKMTIESTKMVSPEVRTKEGNALRSPELEPADATAVEGTNKRHH